MSSENLHTGLGGAAPEAAPSIKFTEFNRFKVYPDPILNAFGANLVKRLHFTMGAHYEAAKRLSKKARISVLSILVLTFYAMFFSMISTIDKVADEESKDLLSLLSLFMSSFIAAFSVYESAKRYDVRAELFLRSARLIQGVRDRFAGAFLSQKATWDLREEFEKEYQRILETYPDNHANIDFLLFRMNANSNETTNMIKLYIMYYFSVYWILVLSISTPALVYVLYYVVVRYTPAIIPFL